jgi:hypothetical protein
MCSGNWGLGGDEDRAFGLAPHREMFSVLAVASDKLPIANDKRGVLPGELLAHGNIHVLSTVKTPRS